MFSRELVQTDAPWSLQEHHQGLQYTSEDDGLGMLAGCDGTGISEPVEVDGFLAGLSLTVSAVTGLVVRDADEFAVLIQPRDMEMGNSPATEAEPTAKETDKPCLKAAWSG